MCLYCLREQRMEKRRRLYRMVARGGLATSAGVIGIALIVGAVMSLGSRETAAADSATSDGPVTFASTASRQAAVKTSGSSERSAPPRATSPAPDASSTVAAGTAEESAAAASTAAAGAAVATQDSTLPRLEPAIADGRTNLGAGVFAERAGDSVIVHFDTEDLRTRFDWKFEGVVRSTLPAIFPQAGAALNAIPEAELVRGDLLEELPVRGIRLDLGERGELTLWPRTRPGQDGPLVVAYRVTATR